MQKAMSSFKEVDRTAAILKEDPKNIFQKVFVAKNLVAPCEGVVRGMCCRVYICVVRSDGGKFLGVGDRETETERERQRERDREREREREREIDRERERTRDA